MILFSPNDSMLCVRFRPLGHSSSLTLRGNDGILRCTRDPSLDDSWSGHIILDSFRRILCTPCGANRFRDSAALDRRFHCANDQYFARIVNYVNTNWKKKISHGGTSKWRLCMSSRICDCHLQFRTTFGRKFTMEYDNIAHWSFWNDFWCFSLCIY